MRTTEQILMAIAAKAWSCAAAVYMIIPDEGNAKRLSDEFKAIQKLADDGLRNIMLAREAA